ncbi:MAG TPA: hypothetical protein DIT48_05445, partial [Actinobacteria bacterium]|nr:hypothetical protein [Actinomycetota bacterium]
MPITLRPPVGRATATAVAGTAMIRSPPRPESTPAAAAVLNDGPVSAFPSPTRVHPSRGNHRGPRASLKQYDDPPGPAICSTHPRVCARTEVPMNVRYRWGAAGVLLGALAMVAIPSFGGSTPSPRTAAPASAARTITVTGLATVKSQPDLAVVSLGVQVQAGSASDAMRINAQRMSKV